MISGSHPEISILCSQSTAANQVARKILASLGTQPSREQWQGRRLGLNLGWACFAVGCRRLLCLAGVLFTLLSCCVCVLFIRPAKTMRPTAAKKLEKEQHSHQRFAVNVSCSLSPPAPCLPPSPAPSFLGPLSPSSCKSKEYTNLFLHFLYTLILDVF